MEQLWKQFQSVCLKCTIVVSENPSQEKILCELCATLWPHVTFKEVECKGKSKDNVWMEFRTCSREHTIGSLPHLTFGWNPLKDPSSQWIDHRNGKQEVDSSRRSRPDTSRG